jgi:hypothetical protein
VVVTGYFINGYSLLFYLWLLMVILLMAIHCYFMWLLMVILLMDIDGFFINDY